MKICDGNRINRHEEIVYDESACPLCEAVDKIATLESENEVLEEEIEHAKKCFNCEKRFSCGEYYHCKKLKKFNKGGVK